MINLSEIKDIIDDVYYKELESNNNKLFDSLKPRALETISRYTNIEIAEERPVGYDWIITPFAYIINYMIVTKFKVNELQNEVIKNRYNEAIKILKMTTVDTKIIKSKTGAINGIIE